MILDIKEKDNKLYLPEKAFIRKIEKFTDFENFYRLELASGKPLGHVPGQFVQVSLLGIGEAPISISSPPSNDNLFDLCVRRVGNVTNKLHTLKEGDHIWIRGPYGRGYDYDIQEKMAGKHLLFIAGGIGYAPLRSMINMVIRNNKNYKKITILYGCKTPAERMYKAELEKIENAGENIELMETVDNPYPDWKKNVGVITTLIPKVKIEDPAEIIAAIVGPPVMYKFVILSLIKISVPKENIYMSLERRMKCGIGKCGHCQMGGIYVCQEGPVFNFGFLENKEEVF